MKAFIVGHISISDGNNLTPREEQKKTILKKSERNHYKKICAEVIDLKNIDKNKVGVKIFGGKLLHLMVVNEIYIVPLQYVSIAKEKQWKNLL